MSTTTVEHNLIEWTRKVAAANPDFVYEPVKAIGGGSRCMYVRDGKPSCIIGHSALEAGLIDPSFENNSYNDLDVMALLGHLGISKVEHADRVWLEAVQEAQDTGQTWREAIESADQARAEYIEAEGDHDDN